MSRSESAHVPVLYEEMWDEFRGLRDDLAVLEGNAETAAGTHDLLRTIRARVEDVYRHDRWDILDMTADLRDQRTMWKRHLKKTKKTR